jgi:hypothetical protein
MAEPVTITLTKSLTAHGQTCSTITIREPTGKDLRQCGYPFIISKEGQERKIDGEAISKLIANCSQIPLSSVDMMGPADWNEAMAAVISFFATPESSPATPST